MPATSRKWDYVLSSALLAILAAMVFWAFLRPPPSMPTRSVIDDINEIQITDPELRESLETLKRDASRTRTDP